MITCNFMGGLGNNLFQLANLYSIHKKYKIPYFITNFVDRGNIHIFNQSANLEINELFDNKFVYGNFDNLTNMIHYNHLDSNTGSDFLYKSVYINDNVCYNGYFQSEKYFLNIDIKSEFVLNHQIIKSLKQQYQHLFCKPTIALHYRLAGDRILENIQFYHKNVSKQFYLKALEIICKNDISNYNILLFSDNLLEAKQILKDVNVIPIDNQNDNIKDFILMSLCDYNIIGNSTFSWWSAYMNKNNKLIIAPKTEWFGQGYKHVSLNDLFPHQWVTL